MQYLLSLWSRVHRESSSMLRPCMTAAQRWRSSQASRQSPLFVRQTNTLARSYRNATCASPSPDSTNPPLSFPCLDAVDARTARLSRQKAASLDSGPEPSYTSGSHLSFQSSIPLLLDWGGVLPSFTVAYETWGSLNAEKSNAILVHTGLSASSHAHSTPTNTQRGWWEKFIGPRAPLDTDKYFVICTNVIGGCFGSTGPSSIDPSDGRHYATRFPIITIQDMVRAQFRLVDHLGISSLYASVGASMGGMQSLAAAKLFPDRVRNIVSISGCARSHPYSIAMRHTQRQVLMMDVNWRRGFYYDSIPPHSGMKLAREIATVTYRSGPEWEARFGRRRADAQKPPALCPDFLIETYLDHAGEKWCLEYDPNSFLYVSKAMDLFDLGESNMSFLAKLRRQNARNLDEHGWTPAANRQLSIPDVPYEEQEQEREPQQTQDQKHGSLFSAKTRPPGDLVAGLSTLSRHRTLVLGVASDILFPAWQQREVVETLRAGGNDRVQHVELGEEVSLFGHDTFLLAVDEVGGRIGEFLGDGKFDHVNT